MDVYGTSDENVGRAVASAIEKIRSTELGEYYIQQAADKVIAQHPELKGEDLQAAVSA